MVVFSKVFFFFGGERGTRNEYACAKKLKNTNYYKVQVRNTEVYLSDNL